MPKIKKTRKSIVNSHSKRKTYFKKGNKIHLASRESYKSNTETSVNDYDSSVNSPLKRPAADEFSDALEIQSKSGNSKSVVVLPSKLRPEKDNKDLLVNDLTNSNESEENIIVQLSKLPTLISAFQSHECPSACPDIKIEKQQGLCVSVRVICNKCVFRSDEIKLFSTFKPARGPDGGTLNIALLIPVLKSRVGLSDIIHILTCLNIKAPNRPGMQIKVNKLADLIEKLNKNTMLDNQTYVRKVLELAGAENLIDTEVDSSFNNRPQAGFEAATQTFSPLVEQCTSKKLTMNIITGNKLCTIKNCQHNSTACKKNYNTDESIASSEAKFVKQHLKTVNEQNIVKVRSVTSDASAQVEKAVRDYAAESRTPTQHYKCLIHKLRTLQKHLRNFKLSSSLFGLNKDVYTRKLATGIRARIRVELLRIKKVSKEDRNFRITATKAIENVIPCFANDHSNCQTSSFVCTAHLSTYNTSHLPYAKHLELNQYDICRLKALLMKNFSDHELQKIARLSTTNKCENLHHKVFSFAPKNTIWTRNFTGLCHSAVHSSSLGNGKACILLAKAIGLKYKKTDPFVVQMKNVDRTNLYHTQRKQTRQYKYSRYLGRKKRSNKNITDNSLYKNCEKNVMDEHGYANKHEFT